MGKKIDLNSPKKSDSSINRRKTNHSYSQPLPRKISPSFNNNQNPENQEQDYDENGNLIENNKKSKSPSKIQKKAGEVALRSVGVPKGLAKNIANDDRTYELADKLKAEIIFPKKKIVLYITLSLSIGILLFLMLFLVLSDEEEEEGKLGLNNYPYYEDACTAVKVDGDIVDIDDYAASVIAGEVGSFSDETLKVFAIAARTYIMHNGNKVGDDRDSCYYQVLGTNDSFQVYAPELVSERHKKAAEETRGLIITIDGVLNTANYDASCVYTAAQASSLEPNKNFTDDNIYIKYGSLTIGGNNFQPIPKSNINIGTLSTYASLAAQGKPCSSNHGYGLSQNGSAYLESTGYNWENIIDYYYQGTQTIMSIYESYGYNGEYPIDPNADIYQNLHFLANYSLTNMLDDKGGSIQELESTISSSIQNSGYGTREGSVSAAVTLIGYLAERGYKINYEWGGKYYSKGVNGSWGNSGATYCGGHPSYNECLRIYRWKGFDCSGFVGWILYNSTGSYVSTYEMFHSSSVKSLSSSEAVCQPGDALYSSGHIVFVVGIDDSTNNYIVAEATGYAGLGVNPTQDASNSGGVKLSYYSFNKSGYKCRDFSSLYK